MSAVRINIFLQGWTVPRTASNKISASGRPGHDIPDCMEDEDVEITGLVSGGQVLDMKVLNLAQRHACFCICHHGKWELVPYRL